MGKKMKDWVSNFELPEEIIVDILSRLPVKALLRFKSVCKLWKALISSPNFILSTTGRERALVFCLITCRARNVVKPFGFHSVDDDLSVLKLPHPIGEVPSFWDKIQLFGSCNGLILFCAERRMYLWNPSTRNCIELSQLSDLVNGFQPRDARGIASGMCFDKSSDDYKIVLVNTWIARIDGITSLRKSVYVASLSKGENWRDISFPYKIPYPDYFSATSTSGVLVNGHLHWLVNKEIGGAQLIVYFDHEINQFRELPMPDDEPEFGGGHYAHYFGLAIVDGCLCMSRVLRGNYGYTWPEDGGNALLVMREYGVKNSWMKLCTIRGLLVPLHTRISSKLVLVAKYPYMGTYDIENKNFRRIIDAPVVAGEDCNFIFNYEPAQPFIGSGPLMYMESLASVDSIWQAQENLASANGS